MRKVLIVVGVLLVLLVLAGVGGIYYVGSEAEKRFDASLERFSSPPSMVFKKVRYERSLLGAEAETALEVMVGPQAVAIPFRHTIKYAPLASGLAEVHTELAVPEPFKPMVAQIFGGAAPLTADTVLNFDGTEVSQFLSPPVTIKDPKGTFTWQGITGTATVEGTHVVMNATAPGLKGESPLGNLILQNLVFNADMTMGEDDLWLGTASVQMGKLNVGAMMMPTANIEGLRIGSETAEQVPGLLRSKVALDIQRLAFEDLTFTKLGYEIELSNLDRAVFAQISQKLEGFTPSEKANAEIMALLQNKAPLLLKRSPKLNLKRLTAITPWGDFKASASAVFDGKGELPKDMLEWLTRITVDAKLDISSSLTRRLLEQQVKSRAAMVAQSGGTALEPAAADQMAAELAAVRMSRLEAAGALVAAGERYNVDVKFADGAFTVNGKDVKAMAALMD